MQKILLLFFISISTSGFAQTTVNVRWTQHSPPPNTDTLYYYPKRKLVWGDFQGTPGNPADAIAITYSGFGYLATMQYNNKKTDIVIDVYCYFYKKKSWVRDGRESNYALNHEQHHFDVTYIITNSFIQKLRAAKLSRNNYGEQVEKIYNETCRELEKMQDGYDGQTKNGQLKNIQAEWNDRIKEQLKLL